MDQRCICLLGLMLISACSGFAESRDRSTVEAREHVILVHGYGRSARAMKTMERRFVARGYVVHTMDYSTLTRSIEEVQREISSEIDQVLKNHPHKTHFVGHSLGGLLVRAYLGTRKVHRLGRVVTLGSPNRGTPAVDYLERKWWFRLIGSAAQALRTSGSQFLSSLPRPTYPLGVIAGRAQRPFVRGAVFEGAHDGLIPLESTKVKGMQDFCVLNVNHTALRYHRDVFIQIEHFLKRGHFDCTTHR